MKNRQQDGEKAVEYAEKEEEKDEDTSAIDRSRTADKGKIV